MEVLQAKFVRQFVEMANDGYTHGYHERNGGNLSYWILPEELEQVRAHLFPSRPWMDIGTEVPELAGEYFLVSGTGCFFRHIKDDTVNTCGIIEVDLTGEKFRILWGFESGGRPTSELPAHLMNHAVKKGITNGKNRVIYHSHPVNLIALTFLLPLNDSAFTKELWQMMTECPVIFPDGIGVLPWMVPGQKEIAVATSKKMKDYNAVVWAHHGIFVSGTTVDEAFGLCHTIEKSAEIAVKVRSVSHSKLQTITRPMLRELAAAFKIKLAELFMR